MSTPAERAQGIAALKAAVAEATQFLADMEIPANVDNQMAGLRDDIRTLQGQVLKLQAPGRGKPDA